MDDSEALHLCPESLQKLAPIESTAIAEPNL